MTPSEQPPEETFCLDCGPDATLERHGGPVLHCPRCGTRQPVPNFPLFVVTGASGTGKTTITGPLRQALPSCDVFDIDITLQVAALGRDTWRNTWLRLAHAIALNGRVTVLCGSLMPDQIETLPARKLIGPIRFCNLDCPTPSSPTGCAAGPLGAAPPPRMQSPGTSGSPPGCGRTSSPVTTPASSPPPRPPSVSPPG